MSDGCFQFRRVSGAHKRQGGSGTTSVVGAQAVICFAARCVHVCLSVGRLQRCRPMTEARGPRDETRRRGNGARRTLSLIFPLPRGMGRRRRPRLTHFPAPDNEVNGRRERLLNFNYTRTPNVHV